MNDRFFRHCVVVDNQGKVVGVISDRDIFRALARYPNSRTKSLEQIMTHNPITVKRKYSVIDAVFEMLAKRINCLPVVEDDGSVCGIVTSTDLLKSYQQILEFGAKASALSRSRSSSRSRRPERNRRGPREDPPPFALSRLLAKRFSRYGQSWGLKIAVTVKPNAKKANL